jgi:adenosylhomocysteine nucleosidase
VLAIVSAMREEISRVSESLSGVETRHLGQRHFHLGTLHDAQVVVVFSRMGKVAAAATVTQLLASFPVTEIVFTGLAGGIRPDLAIGDIVVATDLIQHDMDASPLFPRYEVPLLGRALFSTDLELSRRLERAASGFLSADLPRLAAPEVLGSLGISAPRVVRGVVASGDRFFSSSAEVQELHARLPDVACVEMEGAAVAQVCCEYSIPFGVVRTISDIANEDAAHDFPKFLQQVARHYSAGIVARFLRDI